MRKIAFLSFVVILVIGVNVTAQNNQSDKEYYVSGIGFYNLENLFDTIVDPDTTKILQEDFTPHSKKAWTSERYFAKLDNMAKVIADLGTEVVPHGLALLGVAEIENRTVLEDLVKREKLKGRNYQVVHYDSPDRRGIDIGLIYNPTYFKVESTQSYTLPDTSFYTRDQLLVNGYLDGELIHVIVGHWPSRRGGEKRSAPRRIAAAKLARSIVDSIQEVEPNAKILVMGDLNDDPTNQSVKKYLNTVADKEFASKKKMFNPWENYYKKGIGTLAYRDTWNLFDQIIISGGLSQNDYSSYNYYNSFIYAKNYLKQSTGRYAGYPFRTYAGGAYAGGYSDHFPVYMFLVKEK